MRKLLIVCLVILAAVIVAAGGFGIYITWGLRQGENLSIADVDISKISDGTYTGSYKASRWGNTLEVQVEDQKIKNISVIKDIAFPMPEVAEKTFKSVIEKQKVNLDAVSGATVTSKAYLKSIENALVNGEKH